MKKFDAPQYLQLNKGGAVARLNILKMAAHHDSEQRPPSKQIDWRKSRRETFLMFDSGLAQGYNTKNSGTPYERKTPIWYCHSGEQFRNECDAHEVEGVRMGHTGWYADPDGDNLYVPIVAQLTHGRWIAGYRISGSGERTYFGTIYDEARDAANAGDNEARIDAETECEYQEKYQAAHALNHSIYEQGQDVARRFALRNTSGFDDASSMRELCDAIKSLRDDKQRYADNYADMEGI